MISTPLIDSRAVRGVLSEVLVLDARTGGEAEAAFEAGHVRGAIRVDLETDLSDPGDTDSRTDHRTGRIRTVKKQILLNRSILR